MLIVNAGGAFTVIASACVALSPTLSATFSVTEPLPPPVGVPLMVTDEVVLDPSDKPGGRVPELTVHVSGVVPPVPVTVCEYAVPAVAAGRDVVEIAGAGLTVICALADLLGSVTEVAVTVAAVALATVAGATKVAPVELVLVKVPPPVTAHFRPPFFVSLTMLAVSEILMP